MTSSSPDCAAGDTAPAKLFRRSCARRRPLNIGVPASCSTPIVGYLPSPADRPFTGGRQVPAAKSPRDGRRKEPGCQAFVVEDDCAIRSPGRITMFRVVSGALKADSTVHNKTQDAPERFGHLLLLQGKTQTQRAGNQGRRSRARSAKLKDTLTNDTLGDKADPIAFPPHQVPRAGAGLRDRAEDAAATRTRSAPSMHRLEEEDPSIRYSRDPQTKELLLAGQGQLHIEVTVAKLKRRFGVDVNLKPPRIPYRETIKASTEAHGRHKKQTGGHGQFGDCKITVEPLPRGADFEFVDDIFGGSIPRQFVPAVEKGIQDARTRGYLAGYPMVDFRVTVYDGSYHDVDSNELSFKLAGSLAFKDAHDARAGRRSSSRS